MKSPFGDDDKRKYVYLLNVDQPFTFSVNYKLVTIKITDYQNIEEHFSVILHHAAMNYMIMITTRFAMMYYVLIISQLQTISDFHICSGT